MFFLLQKSDVFVCIHQFLKTSKSSDSRHCPEDKCVSDLLAICGHLYASRGWAHNKARARISRSIFAQSIFSPQDLWWSGIYMQARAQSLKMDKLHAYLGQIKATKYHHRWRQYGATRCLHCWQLWDNFETIMRQLWDNFETNLRRLWNNFVTSLRETLRQL